GLNDPAQIVAHNRIFRRLYNRGKLRIRDFQPPSLGDLTRHVRCTHDAVFLPDWGDRQCYMNERTTLFDPRGFQELDALSVPYARENGVCAGRQIGRRVGGHYDDGGYAGGNLERPALQKLLTDLQAGKIDCVGDEHLNARRDLNHYSFVG